MSSDSAVKFEDTSVSENQQYLRLLAQGRWLLNPSTESCTIGFWIKLTSSALLSTDMYVFSFDEATPNGAFVVSPDTPVVRFGGDLPKHRYHGGR